MTVPFENTNQSSGILGRVLDSDYFRKSKTGKNFKIIPFKGTHTFS